MGGDDVTRIFGKLDALAIGQEHIKTNQEWVMKVVDENKTTLNNIVANGCSKGEQYGQEISYLRSKLNGKSTTVANKEAGLPWWKIGKDGLQFHAPAIVLVSAFALVVGAYVYLHGRTVEKNAEKIAVVAVDDQTRLIRATIDEVRKEIREKGK